MLLSIGCYSQVNYLVFESNFIPDSSAVINNPTLVAINDSTHCIDFYIPDNQRWNNVLHIEYYKRIPYRASRKYLYYFINNENTELILEWKYIDDIVTIRTNPKIHGHRDIVTYFNLIAKKIMG